MPISFVHDPNDKDDYSVDWGTKRLGTGETVTVSTWAVPVGITQTTPAPSISVDGKTTTIWLTGGTDGVDYDLTNHVTTNQGREADHTITIKARQR